LGVLCFACAVLAPKARFRVAWALISVLLVVQSRSATSMALVVITLATALFSALLVRLGSVQKKRVVIAIMGTIGAAFAVSVFLDATFAAGLLGRDKTLTGRTAIWDFVLDRIWQKPWLGHGYMSYWNVENEFTINIKRIVGFPVTSAHQATLDILLSLGLIGATLMVLLLGTAILRTFGDRSVPGRSAVRPEHLRWARGIVLIYAIETFSESCLTTVFVVPLLLVVAAITSQTTFFRHRYK
jgi:O-antigen ligase